MNNKELLELEFEITNLEKELSKLKDMRRQLKSNITYLIGCHLNRGNYYYKVLSVNTISRTVDALCVTYEENEDYGISLIYNLEVEYVNGLALISSETFEKLYKEVMDKISK